VQTVHTNSQGASHNASPMMCAMLNCPQDMPAEHDRHDSVTNVASRQHGIRHHKHNGQYVSDFMEALIS
jgi:hypothetical protein